MGVCVPMLINLSAAHLSVGVSCDVCSSCVYVVNIIIVCHGQSVCVWGGCRCLYVVVVWVGVCVLMLINLSAAHLSSFFFP